MLGRHKYQQAYMPLGDLFLEFPHRSRSRANTAASSICETL